MIGAVDTISAVARQWVCEDHSCPPVVFALVLAVDPAPTDTGICKDTPTLFTSLDIAPCSSVLQTTLGLYPSSLLFPQNICLPTRRTLRDPKDVICH